MSHPAERINWQQLREFSGTRLDGSFVVEWRLEGETLQVEVDLQLLPEHPFYEKPRPKERICIRAAVVEFPFLEGIIVDGEERDELLSEQVAGLAAGAITNLWRVSDGPYVLQGTFGEVEIASERPILRMREL